MNERVSILIPARNEKYLEQTLRNVLENARGDIEIIVELDGWVPDPVIKMNDDRVIFYHNKESIGQRQSLNHAARVCSGKYVMKLDAHCAVDEGFDVKLKADCEYDWTVVPRMYNLNIETFKPKLHKLTDYMYIGMRENGEIRSEYYKGSLYKKMHKKTELIDDTMGLMGPCFFMHKDRFWDLGGCDEGHGSWGQQGIEVSLKAWLSGGRMVVNKKTWFSHWFRGNLGFPYSISGNAVNRARVYSKDLWINNKWPLQKRNFEWVLEKFKPPSWNVGVPEGLWYQEAVIKGVPMPSIRGKDTNEKRWETYIKPFLSDIENSSTFVDLGCNAGFYCRKMSDEGFAATGVEKDIKYFNHAKYWEKEEPKKVALIHKSIVDYDIPKTDVVLLANVHYWLTDNELKSLVEKLIQTTDRVIIIGRHQYSELHKSHPGYKRLKVLFKDWKIVKTIKGGKHFSVLFENKNIKKEKQMLELNVRDFFMKQQCSRSRKYYPSFKKMIETGDSRDYMEYLKWRRFKNPEAILKKHQTLIMSVKENGLLTPIAVDGFTILDGDHRLIIAEVLGMETIKAEQGAKVTISNEHKKINAAMYHHIHKKKNYPEWRGVDILKSPEDLLLYSQIVWETKPEVIVEVGTKWGGSALFHQDNLDLLGNNGKIMTVDIKPQVKNKDSRITYVIGDSTSEEVLKQIKDFTKGKRTMLILDGDHRKEKVLLELKLYADLVSSGCYLVLEDCYVSGVELHGPGEARDVFLGKNNDFIQTNLDRKFITGMLIGGWLLKK